MNTLTQYGLMAEKHWREHRPKMVRELEAKGQLQEMLLEAERKTKDEMAELRTRVHQAGIDAATGPRPRLGNGAGGIHPAPGGRDLAVGHQDDSPRISTTIASPTTTAWARAAPSKNSCKTSGPSRCSASWRPRRDPPPRTRKPCWSSMSVGARCPRSLTTAIGNGQTNGKHCGKN